MRHQSEPLPLSENNEVILVVEDNAEVRELTLQRVEGLGYVAIEAESGPAAVRIIESGEHVDLVLSDIVMAGGMSGYDLARWIGAARSAHPRRADDRLCGRGSAAGSMQPRPHRSCASPTSARSWRSRCDDALRRERAVSIIT